MTAEAIRVRVRDYIRRNFLYTRPDFQLDEDADLFRTGIIDSIGVMELIEFMQQEFEITIEEDDITEENLGTVAAIARYVSKRSNVAAA